MTEAQRPERRLKQSVELGTLLACYGGLLTQKQRDALRLHCDEDLTLAEIADEMAVSRQNVHELITRSEQKLRRYEAALHLAAQAETTRESLTRALSALSRNRVAESKTILTQLLKTLDEEEAPDGI
ncbi:MAG TPA: sigma factor-like helix-turn-helix DNA-binding protein [Candidatus Limiplasma sp.]|nr:sigma factor-like helix-turn-helix DNA-binding protein [Candidatus Limiplasma sp.]HPS82008.1 sigma factor-like helix-turn-helix DNA-binding protein [Candidatus Limiplasma sp.]